MAMARDHGLPTIFAAFITSLAFWFQSVMTSACAVVADRARTIAMAGPRNRRMVFLPGWLRTVITVHGVPRPRPRLSAWAVNSITSHAPRVVRRADDLTKDPRRQVALGS